MFNDEPTHLCDSVLCGDKTQTRRCVPASHIKAYKSYLISNPNTQICISEYLIKRGFAKFIVGEVVAVAQSYKSLGLSPCVIQVASNHTKDKFKQVPISSLPGWNNKMYVSACFMKHHIKITGVRVERLQDITYEDIRAEGIIAIGKTVTSTRYGVRFCHKPFGLSPRKAFAKVFDITNNAGSWKSNPLVYVYEFTLVD